MRKVFWFLAISIVGVSCNEGPSDSCEESELDPSKRIVLIKEQDIETHFYYACNTLIKTKIVTFTRDESWHEYKYVDDLVKETSNLYETATFFYDGGQLTGLGWSRSGRLVNGSYHFKYNSAGKVESLIGSSYSPGMTLTVRNKLVWNGDNVEKRIVEEELWNKGSHTVSYDTVHYEYGDGLNPFHESIYSGYTFLRYTEAYVAPYLSKNVLLKESHQGGEYLALFQYVFDQENLPVKITETTTNSFGSSISY